MSRNAPGSGKSTSKSALIAPSILSADFAKLGEELRAVTNAGADWIHLDVMDGHFVPNLTFGPPVIKALRPHTNLYFDAHLMVNNPDLLLEAYKDAGVQGITVHAEVCPHLHRTLQRIKDLGLDAGISYNPGTALTGLEYVLENADMVLLMSVNPGFGGQSFISSTIEKIRTVATMAKKYKPDLRIQVDGGVKPSNGQALIDAGANVLVAGSAIFKAADYADAIEALRY